MYCKYKLIIAEGLGSLQLPSLSLLWRAGGPFRPSAPSPSSQQFDQFIQGVCFLTFKQSAPDRGLFQLGYFIRFNNIFRISLSTLGGINTPYTHCSQTKHTVNTPYTHCSHTIYTANTPYTHCQHTPQTVNTP